MKCILAIPAGKLIKVRTMGNNLDMKTDQPPLHVVEDGIGISYHIKKQNK